jgi:hypothetical protein
MQSSDPINSLVRKREEYIEREKGASLDATQNFSYDAFVDDCFYRLMAHACRANGHGFVGIRGESAKRVSVEEPQSDMCAESTHSWLIGQICRRMPHG